MLTLRKWGEKGSKRYRCVVLLMLGLLAACDTPFGKDLNAGWDESAKPTPAEIVLSQPPKSYPRERLLQSRETEVAFLNQLRDSVTPASFKSDLTRSLETIVSISAHLQASFLGGTGDVGDLTSELSKRKIEVKLAQFDYEIAKSQALIKQLEEADEIGSPASFTPTTPPDMTEALKELTTALNGLKTSQDTLVALLGNLPSLSDFPATAASSPFEALRDITGYRDEINSLIEKIKLDETHDQSSRFLHRLQFDVKVTPGLKRDVWGVIAVNPAMGYAQRPPVNSDGTWNWDAVSEPARLQWLSLYAQWMEYVAKRLNEPNPRAEYDTLGITLEIYDILELQFGTQELRIPVPIDWAKDITSKPDILDFLDQLPEYLRLYTRVVNSNSSLKEEFKLSPKCTQFADLSGMSAHIEAAKLLPGLEPALSAEEKVAVESFKRIDPMTLMSIAKQVVIFDGAFGGNSVSLILAAENSKGLRLDPVGGKSVEVLMAELIVESRAYLKALADLSGEKKCQTRLGVERMMRDADGNTSFIKFVSALMRNENSQQLPVAFAYSVSPREQAQRVGTVASQVDALSISAAISAMIPQTGISLGGALSGARTAAGKASALERVPRVLGFAGSSGHGRDAEAQFGWLLGPKALLGSEDGEIRFEQVLDGEEIVSVDLSVPGWWNYADLEYRAYWTGRPDLRLTEEELKAIPVRRLFAALNVDDAMMDRLTSALSSEFADSAVPRPSIDFTIPRSPSYNCNKVVSFMVRGQDLFRYHDVVLGGWNAKRTGSVTLQDDMGGLQVVMSMDGVQTEPDGKYLLTIVTNDGLVHHHMNIVSGCPNDPNAGVKDVAVTLSRNAYWKDLDVALRVAGPLPYIHEVKMGVDLGAGTLVASAPLVLNGNGTMLNGKFGIVGAENLPLPIVTQPHLLIQRLANAAPIDVPLSGQIVIYAEQPTVKVETQMISNLQEPILLALPPHFQEAFPAAVNGPWIWTARVTNGPALVARTVELTDDGKLRIFFAPEVPGSQIPSAGKIDTFAIKRPSGETSAIFQASGEVAIGP